MRIAVDSSPGIAGHRTEHGSQLGGTVARRRGEAVSHSRKFSRQEIIHRAGTETILDHSEHGSPVDFV